MTYTPAMKAARHRYYLKHRLEISAKHKEFYEAHKEEIKQKRREYYAKNKEKTLASQTIYREKAREVIRAKNRAYNRSEAGKARDKRYKQSARGREVMAHWKKVWQQTHNKQYEYTIIKGKMKINFIRENKRELVKDWNRRAK